MLSEKHAAKFFEKRLSYDFFAVCPYSCSRILVQSMMQIIKKKIFFFLFTSFADKLLGICKLPKISEKLAVITFELIISLINSNKTGASEDSFF